jgi:hypothetical protein
VAPLRNRNLSIVFQGEFVIRVSYLFCMRQENGKSLIVGYFRVEEIYRELSYFALDKKW